MPKDEPALWEKIVRENLLLFKRPKDYVRIYTMRLVVLVVLVLTVKVAIGWDGSFRGLDVSYATSLVLSLFSIGLACLFYLAADRSARENSETIRNFLMQMRSEHTHQMEQIASQLNQWNLPDHVRHLLMSRAGVSPEKSGDNDGDNGDNGSDDDEQDNAGTAEQSNFALIDSLISQHDRQMLIVLAEKAPTGYPLSSYPFPPIAARQLRFGGKFGFSVGSFDVKELADRLRGTRLVRIDLRPEGHFLALTELGKAFVEWSIQRGAKADFLASPLGGWGDEKAIMEFLKMPPGFGQPPDFGQPPKPPQSKPPEPTT